MSDHTARRNDVSAAFPRAYLRPLLLLLLAESPSHGYDLLEQVRGLGVRAAEPGGLYRALRSMDENGLVASWWEPSQSGPARRRYVITDAGRAALCSSVAELREMSVLLDAVLGRFEQLRQQGPKRP